MKYFQKNRFGYIWSLLILVRATKYTHKHAKGRIQAVCVLVKKQFIAILSKCVFSILFSSLFDRCFKNSLQKTKNTNTMVVWISTRILFEYCIRLILSMLRFFMKRSHSNENKIEINESVLVLMKLEQISELKNARCLLRARIMEIWMFIISAHSF